MTPGSPAIHQRLSLCPRCLMQLDGLYIRKQALGTIAKDALLNWNVGRYKQNYREQRECGAREDA